MMELIPLLEKYKEFLPITDKTPMITLHEGNTPLIRAKHLEEKIDGARLYLKFEGMNPTGSFKDRGMVMAVARAIESGSKTIMCASTGNTSASAAAYAARTGIDAIVLIPKGKIAPGKLSQALAYGAKVIEIDGNFDDCLEIVRYITENYPITLVNSINPYRLQGQKTGAFEIVDELGDAPDYHFIPVGNAGNISAYWMGYKEYKKAGKSHRLPKMMGFQAAGAAPIVLGHVVDKPETVATAIRIGNPANWQKAVRAKDESGGVIEAVTDEEILFAYHEISSKEGIFCEPASAASIAGVIKKAKEGLFKKGEVIVAVLTGNGLKDPDTAVKGIKRPTILPKDVKEVVKYIGL